MKKLTTFLLCLASIQFAQAQTQTSAIDAFSFTSSISEKLKSMGLGLGLETGANTVRESAENKIYGYSSWLTVEPKLKLSSAHSVSVGLTYNVREYQELSVEKNNKDGLNETFVKYYYTPTTYKENNISDLLLNVRYYYTADSFFRDYYGTDANYQLRAYFGRPIVGNLKINKYNSYLRYKSYFANDKATGNTRAYELRARINPTYKVNDLLTAGISFTYNHIFQNDSTNSENVETSFDARLQFNRSYALTMYAEVPTMETNENKVLATTEDRMDKVEYGFFANAYF